MLFLQVLGWVDSFVADSKVSYITLEFYLVELEKALLKTTLKGQRHEI